MDRRMLAWPAAGLVAGLAGLLTSYAAAMVMTIREAPVVAIAELIIKITPGPVTEGAIKFLGHHDKTFLVSAILVIVIALFGWLGVLARRRWWVPVLVYTALAALTVVAVLLQRGAGLVDLVPVAIGYVTWLVVLSMLTEPLRRSEVDPSTPGPAGDPVETESYRHGRRQFLLRTLLIAGAAVVVGVGGKVLGSGRRHVEESRRLLKLDGVRSPRVPAGARVETIEQVTPWQTDADRFYLIHTAIVVPAIEPTDWSLRIHGMVDREIVLTYSDLLARDLTDAWVTLNCVSNPVGGNLIGNAWWSGVLLRDLLEEAGVQDGADAILQTSDDGWNCGTPLAAVMDGRDAMLAVAMNGSPLPIEHGFPVRTIVPGLYGYVSATKWVVDMEVTRFSDFTAYWTQRGWSAQGPVKMASRIDLPRSGASVDSGSVAVGGVAWSQHTGISGVEVALDGGAWQPMSLGRVPSADTWVQWSGTLDVEPGDHLLRVRAIDADGQVQTAVERDVLPDGATGLHVIDFSAKG